MRILKLFVISVVVLFLLLTAMSALLPSTVRISRAVDINAPVEKVRLQLEDLNQWEEWNEYVKAMHQKDISLDTIRSNELKVWKTTTDMSTVQTMWQRQNGKTFPGIFHLFNSPSATTVQWYFEFKFNWYPWEKFGSIVYDKQIGPQMEQSLSNLKLLIEKAP